jgi:hypothetical protein
MADDPIADFYQQITAFNQTLYNSGANALLTNPNAVLALQSATLELNNVVSTLQGDLGVQGVVV